MTLTYTNTAGLLIYVVWGDGLEAAVNAYNISQAQSDYDTILTLIKWQWLNTGQSLKTPLDNLATFEEEADAQVKVDDLVFEGFFYAHNTLNG